MSGRILEAYDMSAGSSGRVVHTRDMRGSASTEPRAGMAKAMTTARSDRGFGTCQRLSTQSASEQSQC